MSERPKQQVRNAGPGGVSAADGLDSGRLARFLVGRLDGFSGPLEVERIHGGQSNPTYLLHASGRRWVLRKRPPGELLPSAHLIDREYRVMSALAGSDVPVPAMRLFCDDVEVLGTTFYVMDFAEGRILRSASLPEVPREARAAHYDAMNATLARLHALDPAALGLADYGKSGDYFGRQIARWSKQYRASCSSPIGAMEALLDWLPHHIPADASTALTHGDYRIDNLVFHPREPRVVALLDWELSTLGHPLADIAYNCLAWHLPENGLVAGGLEGTNLADLGIPGEREYLASYCERTRRAEVPGWPFYLAFSFFRLAAIASGIAARALRGNASAGNAALVGAFAGELAARGQRQTTG